MLKKLKRNGIFRFFSSLKLAVVLLVALAIILSIATFYESVYDTKTAQYLVYKSPLFAAFLSLLGMNVTCSTLMRYPWKKSQTGFVLTHLGIILILAGSLQTMFVGVDGSMVLEEGETSSRVTIDEPVLYFGRDIDSVHEIAAEFRWNRPKPGESEHRFRADPEGEIVVMIDNYYHHSVAETVYTPDEDEGIPAVALRLKNAQVDQTVWLTPASGKMALGPATVDFFRLADAEAEEAFRNPPPESHRGSVQILLDNRPMVVDLDRISETPYPLEYGDASVRLIRYLPHAVVEDGELISRSDEPINPAVEVELTTPVGSQRWLLFSALQELNTRVSSEGEQFSSRLLYNREEAAENGRQLEIGLTSTGELLYRVDGQRSGTFVLDDSVPTGWMDLEATITSFLPQAKRGKIVREVEAPDNPDETAPGPSIRVTLEGAQNLGPYWLERGDILRFDDGDQGDLILGYGYKTVPLEFAVTLKEFRIGYDPGTTNPATYESDVEVEDETFTVAMNQPYAGHGFKVFQASYSETVDGRWVSVFAVVRDPGIGLKYLGSIIMILGIIIMFYFKPKKSRPERVEAGDEESTSA